MKDTRVYTVVPIITTQPVLGSVKFVFDEGMLLSTAILVGSILFGWAWWSTKELIELRVMTLRELSRMSERITDCNSNHVTHEELGEIKEQLNTGFAELRSLFMQLAIKSKDKEGDHE